MDSSASGFWSYAHQDEESAKGSIFTLAASIKSEYDLLTGGDLDLFADRSSLEWGDAWRSRVDASLAQTTFFIAVITPRYFNRPECRREFISFSSRAESLGLREYLLPIIFADVPDLDEHNPDEVKALVARTQFADWRHLRLVDHLSTEYRREVNALVTRIIEIQSRLTSRQLQADSSERDGASPPSDLLDLIEEAQRLIPDWHEKVIAAKTRHAQIAATRQVHYRRERRLNARHAPRSAFLASAVAVGKELKPLYEDYLILAQGYSRICIELDPIVVAILRLVREIPDDLPLIQSLSDAVEDAHESIAAISEKRRIAEDGSKTWTDYFREHARYNRLFTQLIAIEGEYSKLIDEGNAIVEQWREALISIN